MRASHRLFVHARVGGGVEEGKGKLPRGLTGQLLIVPLFIRHIAFLLMQLIRARFSSIAHSSTTTHDDDEPKDQG